MSVIIRSDGTVIADGVDAHTGQRVRPDSAIARALRPVAEPVLREVGLREIDRRLGRALGSTSAALAADYHPSVDWWGDALAACGRGLRVEVAADGTVVRAAVQP